MGVRVIGVEAKGLGAESAAIGGRPPFLRQVDHGCADTPREGDVAPRSVWGGEHTSDASVRISGLAAGVLKLPLDMQARFELGDEEPAIHRAGKSCPDRNN
jgi:hypothetical protein